MYDKKYTIKKNNVIKRKKVYSHKKKKINRLGLKKYKIMSYNVLARETTHFHNNSHNFKFDKNSNLLHTQIPFQNEHIEQTIQRFDKIKIEIEKQAPDIVLLQEVDNYFFTYIMKHLQDYDGYFNLFIPTINKELSIKHGTSIIWRKNKFILNEVLTLDAELYRNKKKQDINLGNSNATYVKLKERNNLEETILVASIHLPLHIPNFNMINDEKKKFFNFILEELNNHESKYKIYFLNSFISMHLFHIIVHYY
jgi:hypothetical protein